MNISSDEILIEAGCARKHFWRDLLRYRELFLFLAWRDILVRYKQTVIGIAWSLIRPVMTMIVFTVVFGGLAKLPSEGNIPYPVMVLSALLPWQLFASVMSESGNSVVAQANMLTKIYFPRIIIPASAALVSLIDFVISCVLLSLLMAYYGYMPSWQILALPFFLVLVLLIALGFGFWLSALNVRYRDFRYIIPFIIQLGLYISPVGFSSSVVPVKWQYLFALNPLVGVIDGFRWSLCRGEINLNLFSLLISVVGAIAVFFLGLTYFKKTEQSFADVI